jgi:hypothetical protein
MPFDPIKSLFYHPEKLLSTVLWLVAFHTLAFGLILIIQPGVIMRFAGFGYGYDHFFPAQGGVFHLLMFVIYVMGAIQVEKYYHFIVFSIFVKAAATFFLLIYSFAVEFKWIILLSGIADAVMGMMIFAALLYYLHTKSCDSRDCKK